MAKQKRRLPILDGRNGTIEPEKKKPPKNFGGRRKPVRMSPNDRRHKGKKPKG